MIRRLLWVALAIATVDPVLLYYIWKAAGIWVVLALLLPLPLCIAALHARMPATPGGALFGLASRFMVWYPGPICKTLALLLMVPFVQRLVAAWALSHLQTELFQGVPPPNFGGARRTGSEPLKQAEGRVIDDEPDLPPPSQEPRR